MSVNGGRSRYQPVSERKKKENLRYCNATLKLIEVQIKNKNEGEKKQAITAETCETLVNRVKVNCLERCPLQTCCITKKSPSIPMVPLTQVLNLLITHLLRSHLHPVFNGLMITLNFLLVYCTITDL